MKYKNLTLLILVCFFTINLVAQPGDPGHSGGGASIPLDGGLLLGLLAGGSALTAYLFKRKKKEE